MEKGEVEGRRKGEEREGRRNVEKQITRSQEAAVGKVHSMGCELRLQA